MRAAGDQPLGHTDPIVAQTQRATFFNALLIGSLLATGLYHQSLYLLNRQRSTTLLFSVCCILFALFDKKLIVYLTRTSAGMWRSAWNT